MSRHAVHTCAEADKLGPPKPSSFPVEFPFICVFALGCACTPSTLCVVALCQQLINVQEHSWKGPAPQGAGHLQITRSQHA
eukprot:scaffold113905_cov19-Tisochrysis_lutea.AAC.1